jgi:hypothetical protein
MKTTEKIQIAVTDILRASVPMKGMSIKCTGTSISSYCIKHETL